MNKLIVAIADVSALQNKDLFITAYSGTTPYRRHKVDQIRMMDDRVLSLGAGVLLDKCLKEFGLENSDIELVENGKPVFKNSNVHFNLSHSGTFAMCAISSVEVGCDIQQMKNIDLKIAKRFFFNTEYENIMAQNDYDSQIEMFFRYWTLKESFMKVTGKGFALPLNEFEINLNGTIPTVNQSLNDKDYSFIEVNAPQGYKASICVCDNKITPQIIDIKV